MFESTLLESSTGLAPSLTSHHRIIAMLAAAAVEILLVGALVLVPLVRTQALDLNGLRKETLYLPPPSSTVRIVAVAHERSGNFAPSPVREGTIIAPDRIPDTIAQIIEGPAPPVAPDIGVVGSAHGTVGIPDSVLHGIPNTFARSGPPPPIETATKGPRRIIQGGNVVAAQLIHKRQPVYPVLAKMARIQGSVRLEAIISTDGRIQNLQVLSGHPMLLKAALDAVAEWRYQPTQLNGEPVEVKTEIVVNFTLGE